MDVLICGTAAAEAWPALFCKCDVCIEARRLGGKNIRSRSGYMIGEEIRIDFCPDSLHHSFNLGIDYSKVRHLLVSHSHWDHWVPEEIAFRRPGFSVVPDSFIMNVYGNEKVFARIDTVIRGDWEKLRMKFVPIHSFEPVELDNGTVATPIRAAHDPNEECVNWIVETGNATFLQAHDTGWWSDETWEYLKGKKLDAVVMDCTLGSADRDKGHLGCAPVARAKEKLAEQGSLAEGCAFIATHFSHNGGWLHEKLEEFFKPHGIEVAFDGMRIPLNG